MNERLEIAARDGQREVMFRGTGIRVHEVLKLLSAGTTEEAVLAQFPPLQPEDIAAARDHDRELIRRWSRS